jgi:hypothetical protein
MRIRASLHRLRKESMLPLILGGAAVHRCGNRIVLNKALAAEGKGSRPGTTFSATCSAMPNSAMPKIAYLNRPLWGLR